MITIHKINKKYILVILLTFIFTLTSFPLDLISSGVKNNLGNNKVAHAAVMLAAKGGSGFHSSSHSSSGSKSSSFKSSSSSKSAEGFKSGSFSSSNSGNSSSKGFKSGSFSKSDNSSSDKNNNANTYDNSSTKGSFGSYGRGYGYNPFYRPLYFGSPSSFFINAISLFILFIIVILLIKIYLNNKRK